jgi:predicted outer membrane repeat protein
MLHPIWRAVRLIVVACLLLGSLPPAQPVAAQATTWVVNDFSDHPFGSCPSAASCTLRTALGSAVAGDTITFTETTPLPIIQLDFGSLWINKSVTITGPNDGLTIIGPDGSQIFLLVNTDATVRIEGITLQGGTGEGTTAIGMMGGNVTLTDVTIRNTTAPANQNTGGAVYMDAGSLTLNQVVFENNRANQGGGIYAHTGRLVIQDSRFTNNQADLGGALYLASGASTSVTNTVFDGNTAVGTASAILAYGTPVIEGSTFQNNTGPLNAVQSVVQVHSGSPEIRRSLFVDNAVYGGGILALRNTQNAVLENNLFTRNSSQNGATVWVDNSFDTVVSFNTIVGNLSRNANGYGLAGAAVLRGNLIVGNTDANSSETRDIGHDAINQAAVSMGGNVIGVVDPGFFTPGPNDHVNVTRTQANLSGLEDFGGATPSMRPFYPSPAIDTLDGAECGSTTTDQRGQTRPVRGACDAGAFEVQPGQPPVPGANSFSIHNGSTLNGQLSATDPEGGPVFYALRTQPQYVAGGGSITLNGDGTFQYTPDRPEGGSASFTFTVTDTNGDAATGTAAITITESRAPQIGSNVFSVSNSVPFHGALTAEDLDNSLPLTFATTSDPDRGTLTAFDPNGSFTYESEVGYTGSDSFDFTVSDHLGNSASGTATLNVIDPLVPTTNPDGLYTFDPSAPAFAWNDIPDAEVFTYDFAPDDSLLETERLATPIHLLGRAYSYVYLYRDGYVELADGFWGGQKLGLHAYHRALTPAAPEASISLHQATDGTLTIRYGNWIDTTAGETVSFGMTVTVDGKVRYDYNAVADNLTGNLAYLTGENLPAELLPVIAETSRIIDHGVIAFEPALWYAGVNQTIDVPAPGVLGNDWGYATGQTLTVTTQPQHGSVTLHNDGSFQYTPEAGYLGYDTFAYEITTISGDTAGGLVTVATNAAPGFAGALQVTVAEDKYDSTELDLPCSDEGGRYTRLVVDEPDHGARVTEMMGCQLNIWKLQPEWSGVLTFDVTVYDEFGASTTAPFTLTVTAKNDTPYILTDGLYGLGISGAQGGPTHTWVDISGSGTEVTNDVRAHRAGPYPLGFAFPMLDTAVWGVATQLEIGEREAALYDSEGNYLGGAGIGRGPVLTNGSHVYYQTLTNPLRTIVQYEVLIDNDFRNGMASFQWIFYPSGEVRLVLGDFNTFFDSPYLGGDSAWINLPGSLLRKNTTYAFRPQQFVVAPGGTITIPQAALSANDFDVEGSPVEAIACDKTDTGCLPQAGTLAYNAAAKTFTYTSTASQPQFDSFGYYATDGTDIEDWAEDVYVLVDTPASIPPQTVWRGFGQSNVTGQLQRTGLAGEQVIWGLVAPPEHGSVTVHANGRFDYVIPDNVPQHTFQVWALDEHGQFDTGTVTIAVDMPPTVSMDGTHVMRQVPYQWVEIEKTGQRLTEKRDYGPADLVSMDVAFDFLTPVFPQFARNGISPVASHLNLLNPDTTMMEGENGMSGYFMINGSFLDSKMGIRLAANEGAVYAQRLDNPARFLVEYVDVRIQPEGTLATFQVMFQPDGAITLRVKEGSLPKGAALALDPWNAVQWAKAIPAKTAVAWVPQSRIVSPKQVTTFTAASLLENDMDDRAGSLAISCSPIPCTANHGTLDWDAAQKVFRYTPEPDYSGQVRIIFAVTDGINQPVTSALVLFAGEPFKFNAPKKLVGIGALEGRVQVEARGAPIEFLLLEGPAFGKLDYEPDTGAFTYTPNPGYYRPDEFTMGIASEIGQLETVTIRLESRMGIYLPVIHR